MPETITQRIDAITAIPTAYQQPKLPAPKSVKIELTPRCNYRCGFCALRTRENQPTEDMDMGLFKRITKEMLDAGVEEIGVFYLGEPFMAPDILVEAITYLKDIGMPYVFLTSNGSLAEPFQVDRVMEAGLDSLKWSVNAADEQQFCDVMGVKSKLFHTAFQNIQDAWHIREANGYKTKLYASSIRYDGEQQERMEWKLKKEVLPFVDEHYWLPLYSMGAFATEREEALGYKPIAGNQGRLEALRQPLPCWSAFTEGHVTARGIVSACCFDASDNWSMGDLNEHSFMDIWNSDAFQHLRAAHLKKDVTGTICEKCVAYK